MPSSRPEIGYRPKRRVEDPLLTLVVDGASVPRAVLHRRFYYSAVLGVSAVFPKRIENPHRAETETLV